MSKPTNYYVPAQSKLPALGALALFFFAFGAGNMMHALNPPTTVNDGQVTALAQYGQYAMYIGLALLVWMLASWWNATIKESMSNMYSEQMDRSFRQGMAWFIVSEVMVFAGFFGGLYYVRALVAPCLNGDGVTCDVVHALWSDFQYHSWPMTSFPDPAQYPDTVGMGPFGLPLINTILLISSSFTLTWAHHALKEGRRDALLGNMCVTIGLGLVFLCLQAYEYYHAYVDMGLKFNSGSYGMTFFSLTGLHGLHVLIGTTFLIVMLVRCWKAHFTPENHFAFEASAWYWHFVDVVWIILYLFVYLL